MSHKAGFVSIVGKPNVGKSTLMNKLLGEDLSIVTHKAQTTRHLIKGVLNGENFQIILSDTPGILQPVYKLHSKMMKSVDSSFPESDIVILVVEAGEKVADEEVLKKIKKLKQPLFVAISKIDLSDQDKLELMADYWKKILKPAELIPVSALENFNLKTLQKKIIEYLPESPPYFSKDDITDRSERFMASEIIREKILLNYQKEIPYSVEVVIDSFKEEEKIIKINAIIYVMRESQKAIILGHKGEAIKRTGTEARLHLEKFLQKKIFLSLTVKISDKWRDDEQKLKRFGYDE